MWCGYGVCHIWYNHFNRAVRLSMVSIARFTMTTNHIIDHVYICIACNQIKVYG